MENWLFSALLAMVFYGIWAFFPKLAVSYISPLSALVYEVAGAALVGVATLIFLQLHVEHHPKGILYALLTGVAGMGGTLFFFHAAQKGKITLVVGLTALYPLVTILLAVIFLHESLSVKEVVALFLAGAAILLLST